MFNGHSVPIFISPDSQLKYLKPRLANAEPELLRLCTSYVKEGSCVWDVGANVGFLTFVAARLSKNGFVLAIEPDSFLVSILEKTALLPQYTKTEIKVLPAAVSSGYSIAEFVVAKRGRANNALVTAGGRSEMGGIRETKNTVTVSLDSLLSHYPAPDLVKIDIEGAEYDALLGATQLLANIRPLMYIEVGLSDFKSIMEIMKLANYEACDVDGNALNGEYRFNILFVPTEK